MKIFSPACLCLGLILVPSTRAVPIWNCGSWCSSPTTTTSNTIVDVAVADGRFTRLVSAVTATGLADSLSAAGQTTVFAPLDSAFASVPAKFLQNAQYREHLRQVLLYHVVGNARVLAASLSDGRSIPTLNGQPITVTEPPPNVELNGSVDVVLADVPASNGVIHVIDEVLLPNQVTLTILDRALASPQLRTLSSLLAAAGIADLFGNPNASFTVFAPTDAAFAKLPQSLVATLTDPANVATLREVLQFHVVSNSVVLSTQLFVGQPIKPGLSVTSLTPPRVNESVIISPNILASNGVVHLIDTVLIPPSGPTPSFPQPMPVPTPQAMPVRRPTVQAGSPLAFNCGTWCKPTPVAMPVRRPTSFPPPSSFNPPPSPPASRPTRPTFTLPTSFGPPPTPQLPTIVDIAISDGRFTTLVAAVTSAGLAGTLAGPGPFTVFAPIDDAFADVPARFLEPGFSEHLRQVLLYHVVGSGAVSARQLSLGQSIPTLARENVVVTEYALPVVELNDSANVIVADIRGMFPFRANLNSALTSATASNGVVHAIDEVLLPSAVTSTILDRVVASPFLSTLENLLVLSGLAGAFDGTDGEVYTVFAPSNAAFNKLPADLVRQLTNPANVATLREVLLFHVLAGSSVPSKTLTNGMQITNGLSVTSLTPIRVNGATVVSPNVLAGNGIVHIIDTVLIPPSLGGSMTNALRVESSAAPFGLLTILSVGVLTVSWLL